MGCCRGKLSVTIVTFKAQSKAEGSSPTVREGVVIAYALPTVGLLPRGRSQR